MHHSSFNASTMAENAKQEARKLAMKFADARDLSFEDLNNISQHLIDQSIDVSCTDLDLLDMKVKVMKKNSFLPPPTSANKMASINEQLRRIKREENSPKSTIKIEISDIDVKVKEESKDVQIISTPVPEIIVIDEDDKAGGDASVPSEIDNLLQNLKLMITDGNKDEAKKQLQRLNEMLGKQKESNEPKSTLHVQPIVRQDTFEIDDKTGSRKYKPNEEPTKTTENDDLIEKLTKLLGGKAMDIRSLNLGSGDASGAKVVVVVPAQPAKTPAKEPRPTLGSSLRPQSALKALDGKAKATPLKRLSHASRQNSFSTPRPMTASKVHPTEQKTATIHPRVSSVRKSLSGAIDKSPQVSKPKISSATVTRASNAPRRSVSMKASIPASSATKSTPAKPIRPSTGAPYMTSAMTKRRESNITGTPGKLPTATRAAPPSRGRTLSEKRTVSQFKAPSAIRKAAAAAADPKGNLV